jgi:hypothetical protein
MHKTIFENQIKKIRSEDIFFITTDVKRGIGLDNSFSKYHIICLYDEPIISILRKQGMNIFCLQDYEQNILMYRNSGKIVQHPRVLEYIKKNSNKPPWIIFFKPSQLLDIIISRNGFKQIGNTFDKGKLFEDKIQFQQMLKKNAKEYCVPFSIGKLPDFTFSDLEKQFEVPFVVQFGFGWAGNTTFFISNEKEFNTLSGQYRFTTAKISKKIKGFTVLNNCCIYNNNIIVGPPAIQISNIPQLFDNPAVTCGRQWPVSYLEKTQIQDIFLISQKIGQLMIQEGYDGYFGMDFLVDEHSGKIYVNELNARLTASSAFYTHLQRAQETIPQFYYHMAQFMKISLDIQVNDGKNIYGSQIILRDSEKTPLVNQKIDFGVWLLQQNSFKRMKDQYYPEQLKKDEYIIIKNKISAPEGGSDEIARIETKENILDAPSVLKKEFLSWLQQKN